MPFFWPKLQTPKFYGPTPPTLSTSPKPKFYGPKLFTPRTLFSRLHFWNDIFFVIFHDHFLNAISWGRKNPLLDVFNHFSLYWGFNLKETHLVYRFRKFSPTNSCCYTSLPIKHETKGNISITPSWRNVNMLAAKAILLVKNNSRLKNGKRQVNWKIQINLSRTEPFHVWW